VIYNLAQNPLFFKDYYKNVPIIARNASADANKPFCVVNKTLP
jgi:hypothetical protein